MMTVDDIYKELSPCVSNSADFEFSNEVGFIWVIIEIDNYLRFPTLSLSGIGQVYVPIFKEVIKYKNCSFKIY